MLMTPVSASKKMIDVHRSAMELVEKAKAKNPWDENDCEVLAQSVASLALLVQDLLLESKRPTREMPILPKRG
jgi:hypothetical protein